jgi:endo-1,4-beta-xylanase
VQGHLALQYTWPTDTLANLRRFEKLGLDTAFTEVDVRMQLPVDPAKTQAQAQGFNLLLQACLLAKRCISFTVWGFTDKYNWVPGVFTGEGYATPLTEDFVRKPAYNAIRDSLLLAAGR